MIGGWVFAGAAAVGAALAAQGEAGTADLPAGAYEGSYACPQGPTGLRVTVHPPRPGQRTARFDFGGHGEVPRGVYLVVVQVEGDMIVLTPLRWLNRPRDYDMVGARLRRSEAGLTGTISNQACGEITLRRAD